MIAIKVQNQFLDVSDGISITLNFSSPMFTDQGSYSYPFKIPLTSRNKTILEHPQNIAYVKNNRLELPCQVYYDGLLLLNGLLLCKSASIEGPVQLGFYEGVIFGDSGYFNYRCKNLYLQSIDFGEISFETEQDAIDYFNGSVGLYYPDRLFALPYIFNDLFLDPPAGFSEMMNFNAPTIIDPETGEWSLYTQNEDGSRTLLIPFLFLRYVLVRLFRQLGYTLHDDFFSFDDFNRLVIYNSYNANTGAPYVLITNILFNMHLPAVTVNDFIKGLETYFGIGFFFSLFSNDVYVWSYDKVIKNSEVVNWSKGVMAHTIERGEPIYGFRLKMTPDDDDDKFLTLLDNEKAATDILKGTVNTVADLPPWPKGSVNETRLVITEGKYYRMDPFKQWNVLLDFEIDLKTQYLYLGADTILESSFSTLTETEDETWPRCQCGNKQIHWKDISPRLLFVDLHPDREYPTPYGRNHTDNMSLWFPGTNGLFERQWKHVLDWKMKSTSATITRKMTIVDLIKFDFRKKYYMLGMRYLVSNIEITIGDTISEATLKCQSCY